MNVFSIFIRSICRILLIVAGIVLAFMLLFTLTDVIGRVFGKPILGVYEVISFLGAVVIGFSLPYTSLVKGHVIVDFMIEKMPGKAGNVMQVATRILSIALFLWMAWNFVDMSLDLVKSKEVTQVFRMPYYPISFGVAFCCIIQCLALSLEIIEIIGGRHG